MTTHLRYQTRVTALATSTLNCPGAMAGLFDKIQKHRFSTNTPTRQFATPAFWHIFRFNPIKPERPHDSRTPAFQSDGGFIRIPIWGHIPLSGPLKKILSHPSFLRLKEIRQLSFSQQVYPTRSEYIHYAMQCTSEYVRFDDLNESVFQSDFILAFERYTKKFRLLCRPDLVERIVESREAIMCLMANDLDLFR